MKTEVHPLSKPGIGLLDLSATHIAEMTALTMMLSKHARLAFEVEELLWRTDKLADDPEEAAALLDSAASFASELTTLRRRLCFDGLALVEKLIPR